MPWKTSRPSSSSSTATPMPAIAGMTPTPWPISSLDAIWEGDLFGRYEGREAIREFFRGVSTNIPFAVHYMTNPIISVDGDEANGEWYLFQTTTFAQNNTPILGSARYADQYRRVDGTWKFRHLQLISIFWTPYEEGWVKRPFIQKG